MSEPIVKQEAEQDYDPHRFSAEPKRKPNKTVLIIIVAFVVLMTLIGASVFITRQYLSDYMAERAERRKEEQEMKNANEEKGRKGKVFGAGSGASGSALPARFGKGDEAKNPDADAAAIPLLRDKAPPPAAPAPVVPVAPPPPPPPPLMAPAASLAGGGLAGSVAAEPAQKRPANVQELAAQRALTAALTATPQVSAANLGNRSYLLARGSVIPCVLETQLVSNIGGSTSCVLPQHVYSDDGKVLLLEKGSSITGIYENNVRTGDSRIAILWQRIKTATGVVIDVDSPAADQLGVMGAPGVVDNHWPERIGAAFLLSMVEDAVAIQMSKNGQGRNSGYGGASFNTTTTLSEKVLDSTINIAPTLYKNRGDRLMVYVSRDLWFNNVYNVKQR
ncbi:type IV secretion system protein VirB10 [Massilia sp. BJB1822]|uniref:type IV secretion system protein VirB10 n=1 Tax=Massilia sp. BJB1822 TaxID=2744470 RepID=UPI001593A2AE|nr:type IV secretion system protein VirB10 [Massilia sp. BJB1822]NVE00163.1 type IV secretion system protein VirB10 [Massilia sp. BJB1822]